MTAIIQGVLCLLTLITSLATAEQSGPEWCGNKHKNLTILKNILQGTPNVQVPPFLCISTGRVEQFLREISNNEVLFEDYKELVRRINKEILRAGESQQPNPDLEGWSNEMIEERIKIYIKSCFDILQFPFTQEELTFFELAATQNRFLMVRSTGVEDNPNAANAGGNASVAYVSPTKSDIQKAMTTVVSSYFGIQSLKNRAASGEELSENKLVVPVLIQLLVGEPKGGATQPEDIPVSGVAYTTNQNISSSNFPITEINATYGHGEGVVANKVIADRYLITRSRYQEARSVIYPLLFKKRERLIPAQDSGQLIMVKNSYNLAHKSALTETQLMALYDVLKKIERGYAQPMDVEFVVVGNQIYIVQARPAMHRPAQPSYFDFESGPKNQTTFSCYTLVPGTGSLQIIDNPDDVIIAKTLDEADQARNSVSAKVVITESWASSLSHAAVNFMSRGTPCLFMLDKRALEQVITQISAQKPLIVDVQRGKILLWDDETKDPHNFVQRGWFEHPVERGLSLFLNDAQILPKGTPKLPKDPKLMVLMERLKIMHDPSQQKNTLTAINDIVEKALDLTQRRVKTTGYQLGVRTEQAFEEFKKVYRNLFNDFSTTIDEHRERFEFLFYHKMLEALLYQIHDRQHVLAGYTYTTFLNEIYEKQKLQQLIKKSNTAYTRELEYSTYCPSQNLSEKWVAVVMALDALTTQSSREFKDDVALFLKFLHDLEGVQSLPLWFATSFYREVHNKTVDQELVKMMMSTIAQSYDAPNQESVAFIEIIREALETIQSQMGKGFGSPTEAQSRWQEIKNKIVVPVIDRTFITIFKESLPVLKMTLCSLMQDTIDILDGTIKELKTSATIPTSQRIELFKMMLADFNTVFRTWVTEIMPKKAIEYNSSWPLESYLTKMQELYVNILNKSIDESIFQKSRSFSVDAAMLGTQTAFERHYPESAEDIFMLIHQNSLVAVAATVKTIFEGKPLNEQLFIPPFLEACNAAFGQRSAASSREFQQIIPIGLTYTSDTITLSYNLPLNNHSGSCQLVYHTVTQECFCSMQYLGQARGRWEQIAFLARISPELSNLTLDGPVNFDEQAGIVAWRWKIGATAQMPTIIEYIDFMSRKLSFEDNLEKDDLIKLYKRDTALNLETIIRSDIARFGSSRTANRLIVSLTPIEEELEEVSYHPIQPTPIRQIKGFGHWIKSLFGFK